METKRATLPAFRGAEASVRVVGTEQIAFVSSAATLQEVARKLASAEVGLLVVGTSEQITGVLSERDVVRMLARGVRPDDVAASAVPSANLLYIDAEATVQEAATLMIRNGVRHLLLREKGEVVGIVSARDILAAFTDSPPESASRAAPRPSNTSSNDAKWRHLLATERQRLLALRRGLTAEGFDHDLSQDPTIDTVGFDQNLPEGATESYEIAIDRSLLDRVEEHLVAISEAEERLAKGLYETCFVCNASIPHERLEAVPTTRHCIVHEHLAELSSL